MQQAGRAADHTGTSQIRATSAGWEQRRRSSRVLQRVSDVVGHSRAGGAAVLLVVGWSLIGLWAMFPPWWQTGLYSVTSTITFVMVFVIQHTQARQIAATQHKLDELIRSSKHADDRLIAVEYAPEEHLQTLASNTDSGSNWATVEERDLLQN